MTTFFLEKKENDTVGTRQNFDARVAFKRIEANAALVIVDARARTVAGVAGGTNRIDITDQKTTVSPPKPTPPPQQQQKSTSKP